jgi:hypothetical protein
MSKATIGNSIPVLLNGKNRKFAVRPTEDGRVYIQGSISKGVIAKFIGTTECPERFEVKGSFVFEKIASSTVRFTTPNKNMMVALLTQMEQGLQYPAEWDKSFTPAKPVTFNWRRRTIIVNPLDPRGEKWHGQGYNPAGKVTASFTGNTAAETREGVIAHLSAQSRRQNKRAKALKRARNN